MSLEYGVDLQTGRRRMQNTGMAPADQRLGRRRDLQFEGLQDVKGAANNQGVLNLELHGANADRTSRRTRDRDSS